MTTECATNTIDFDVHALECDSAQELADYLAVLERENCQDVFLDARMVIGEDNLPEM